MFLIAKDPGWTYNSAIRECCPGLEGPQIPSAVPSTVSDIRAEDASVLVIDNFFHRVMLER